MKKLLTVTIFLIALFAFLVLGSYFYLEAQIKTGVLDQSIKNILSKELKVNFDYESVHFSLEDLAQLKPTLLIKDLAIANYQGYKQSHMLKAQEIFLELYLKPLMQRKIEIKKVYITKPQVTLETNFNNDLNMVQWLESLEQQKGPQIKFKKKGKKKKKKATKAKQLDFEEIELAELSLQDFKISDALLELYPPKGQPVRVSHADLEVKNFLLSEKHEMLADLAFNLRVFNSKKANVVYQGKLGPIESHFSSLQSEGDLAIDLLVNDIPKEIRKENFGNFLLAPGANDKFSIKAYLKGDFLKDIYGSGSLGLNNINVGKSKKRHLKVKTNVPISMHANLVQSQKLSASIKDANIDVTSKKAPRGSLTLNASANHYLQTGYNQANINGRLENLDINEFISSFSGFEEKLYGQFAVPEFAFNFAGADADQIMQTLNGKGFVEIKDGRLYLLDTLIGIKAKAVDMISSFKKKKKKKKKKQQQEGTQVEGTDVATEGEATQGAEASQETQDLEEAEKEVEAETDDTLAKESTKFSSLSTKFTVAQERFNTNGLAIITPLADLRGAGYFDFRQNMNYKLELSIKDVPKQVPVVPIKVRGNLNKPKVRPDFKLLTQEVAKEHVQDAVDFGLGQLENFLKKNIKQKKRKK